MEFENRFLITKERYMNWVKHPIKKSMNYIMRIAWIVLLIFTAGIIFYQVISNDISLILFSCGLALLCIYRVFFRVSIIANKQFKHTVMIQGTDKWERVTTFTDEITVSDGCSVTQFDYDKITELVDYKDYLALGIGPGLNKSYLRLAKDGFGQKTAREFVEFIKHSYPKIPIRNI